jgi:hypothetical protein
MTETIEFYIKKRFRRKWKFVKGPKEEIERKYRKYLNIFEIS